MNNYILPIVVLFIVIYGIRKKINIYDSFIKGSKEGLEIGINIFPSILAIIFSSRILISSGFLSFFLNSIKPILNILSFPIEVFPLAILRPISGNASLSIMIDIFKNHGPDSYLGMLSSILQGCTETTLYVISLYFGTIGIKKIRHTLFVGLLVDLIGVIISIIMINLFF